MRRRTPPRRYRADDPPNVRALSPADLWQIADGDSARYRELMIEHGHLVPKTCGCEGRCEHQNLPCGWPGIKAESEAT